MLLALKASDCPEHECVYAFFTHVQKMFNMPYLYRLSLEQLKGAKQTDLAAGASYVLQFMQARVITMQLANRTMSVGVCFLANMRGSVPAGGGGRRVF